MRPIVIASNMYNERHQLEGWFDCFEKIADGGILIVDGGSTDGTAEYCLERGAQVVITDIIQTEGYGPARNHLREMSRKFFPKAHWMAYFDADERIDPAEFHQFRYIKDYLIGTFDVVAFPRLDLHPDGHSENDYLVAPDWQARMTRLDSMLMYYRRLHEQLKSHKAIYTDLNAPKIHHHHRGAPQWKRDHVGKVCAFLHGKDEFGHTYPEHHKEAHYRKLIEEEGLNG